MNKILNRIRKRNIKSNLKQFLSVIFIVLLASMLFSGFMTNSYILKTSVKNYFEKTNLADLWLTVDDVRQEDEKFLKNNEIDFNKRLYFEAVAEIDSLKLSNSARIYVCKSQVEEQYSAICNPYIESGKIGCLIDKNVAKNHDIHAGMDNVKFSYTVNVGGENVTIDFNERLTGTMSLDECADSYSSWAIVVEEEVFYRSLNAKLKEKIAGFDESMLPGRSYNQILVKADDVAMASNLISSYYSKETTESKLVYLAGRESIESVNLLNYEAKQSMKMIYVFPIIFLVVAVLIILTTIDQLIIQERKRIGILKACGVPNKKILKHYSNYGSILCFIGASIGAVLGIFVIPEIMFMRYDSLYSIPAKYVELKIPIWWLILMVSSIVVLGYTVSKMRCHNILHKNPIECLKYDSLKSARKLKKSKRKFKKVPVSIKMAIRNIKIKPIRTIMATIGIAGCISLLISGFGIGDTLSKSLKNDVGKLFRYDVSSTYKADDFLSKLEGDSKIEYFEKYTKTYVSARFGEENESVYIYGLEENSKISKIKLQGDEVCVSNSVAKKLGIKKGDILKIKTFNKTIELKVTKFVETSFMNGIYVCKDLGFADEIVSKGVYINSNEKASDIVKFVNSINGTNTAKTFAEDKQNVENRILSTSTMTTTIKVFAVMLAVIVLLNLIFLIIKERSTEIATLKVMGFNSLQVSLSVIFEVSFMAIIGVFAGMIFAYPLMFLILSVNKIDIVNYIKTIKFVSFLASIFIIVITILSVLVVCYLKIRKVKMAESLKSVE